MCEEIDSVLRNQARNFDSLPRGQKMVCCKGDVDVMKVFTHNLTDMTTKSVPNNKFRHFLNLIGVCSTQRALSRAGSKEERRCPY